MNTNTHTHTKYTGVTEATLTYTTQSYIIIILFLALQHRTLLFLTLFMSRPSLSCPLLPMSTLPSPSFLLFSNTFIKVCTVPTHVNIYLLCISVTLSFPRTPLSLSIYSFFHLLSPRFSFSFPFSHPLSAFFYSSKSSSPFHSPFLIVTLSLTFPFTQRPCPSGTCLIPILAGPRPALVLFSLHLS